jgi:hypothetical protein
MSAGLGLPGLGLVLAVGAAWYEFECPFREGNW